MMQAILVGKRHGHQLTHHRSQPQWDGFERNKGAASIAALTLGARRKVFTSKCSSLLKAYHTFFVIKKRTLGTAS